MQTKFIFLSLALIINLSPYAHADSELDALMNMSIEELLEVEITSSTHTKEDIFSVPSSITVFTYEQMRQMSVNSLEDLMNYVPGFQANRGDVYTNQKTAYVRGRYTNSGQKDILVLLDGQRLNSDWDGTALNYNRLISLENIERVEFIRGPGSALYGSNAFLGVINLYTKKDLNNIGTRFREDYVNGYLNFTYNEDDIKASAFVKGIYDSGQSYDSQEDLYSQTYRNPKDKNRGSEFYLKGEYKNVSLQMRYQRRDTREWYLLALNSDKSNSTVEHSFFRLGYTYDDVQNYVSKLYVSYLKTEQQATLAGAPFVSQADIKENEIGVQWMNSYTINDENSLNFGAEYRHPKLEKAKVILAQGVTPQENLAEPNSRDIYGIYGQFQGKISDFSLTIGARYDDYSDFGDTFNPRAAIVYQAYDTTSFKLLYGSAFRAPTYNELYYSPVSSEVQGNPNLKPETIKTYEAVIIQEIASATLTLSYFYNDIEDAIVQVRNNQGLLSSINNGNERYTGIEAELFKSFLDNNLNTRISLTHITHSDQEVQAAPDTTISTIINYQYNNLNLNLSGFYHSSAENDYETYVKDLDSYTLVNTKISYQFNSNFMAYFEMQNIFNEKYYTPSPSPSASTGSPSTARPFDIENRGRLSYLGLEYSF